MDLVSVEQLEIAIARAADATTDPELAL